MDYISVRNFEELQHYKNRKSNPWIRLYNRFLNDPDVNLLPERFRFRFIGLLILASETDNRIPADARYIRTRLNCSRALELWRLAQWLEPHGDLASRMLAKCYPKSKIKKESTSVSITSQPEQRGLVMQEPEKPKKPRKQANHVTQIVDYFNARYRQFSHGQPYVGPGVVADRTQVKRLFTSNPRLNPLYVREMVEAFFMALENPDEHRTGNDNGWGAIVPSVTSFCKHIPKIQKRFTMDEPPEVGHVEQV